MEKLIFSYNWNNKLQCKSFSTVRLENPNKYKLLDLYSIVLQEKGKKEPKDLGIARLQSIRPFYLDLVTPAMCYIDANCNKMDFIKLVKTMYKNKNINWMKNRLSFLVFQYLTKDELKELETLKS